MEQVNWRSEHERSVSRSSSSPEHRRRDARKDNRLLGNDRAARLLHDRRHLRDAGSEDHHGWAILWPGLPRLKEWAYAGIFFNMMGAFVSHVAVKDPAWSLVVTLAIAGITLASWALRPSSRKLG
jgi:hypothetical protein